MLRAGRNNISLRSSALTAVTAQNIKHHGLHVAREFGGCKDFRVCVGESL